MRIGEKYEILKENLSKLKVIKMAMNGLDIIMTIDLLQTLNLPKLKALDLGENWFGYTGLIKLGPR